MDSDGVLLLHGACLEAMSGLTTGSIDLVLADLPYGTTEARWDEVIPFAPLWDEYRRVLRPGAAVVLTAQQPFTTDLINSNRPWFRYTWAWKKSIPTGYANAKRRPLKIFEDVVVFAESPPPYYPQGLVTLAKPRVHRKPGGCETMPGRGFKAGHVQTVTNYPRNILEFAGERGCHPTQKPVALFEYLVRTYTRPGETVLDNTMGSGTTGVACVRSDRRFVGIERDPAYFAVACDRIDRALGRRAA